MGAPQHRGTGKVILELELLHNCLVQFALKPLNWLSEKLRDFTIVTSLDDSKAGTIAHIS